MNPDEQLDQYDYPLPRHLIAAEPLEHRDQSRLMRIHRGSGAIEHRKFAELPSILRSGDLLILNETRVLPARLVGQRQATGGRWQGLFVKIREDGLWQMIGKTRGQLLPGETVVVNSVGEHPLPDQKLILTFVSRDDEGEWSVRPDLPGDPSQILAAFGTMPLPPYLRREPTVADFARYQTVFAQTAGALAAPTAGLHFTPELLEQCQANGVRVGKVTLHIGLGTFQTINSPQLADHVMHHEWGQLPAETAALINETKAAGGRVVAVGTTVVRTLESAAAQQATDATDSNIPSPQPLSAWEGETNLFIRPPYSFRVVDALVTNFHLPQSTLQILVSAFWDRKKLIGAYRTAIAERYRFFSYGDAMFLE